MCVCVCVCVCVNIIIHMQCEERKKKAQYGSAKTYGKIALGLNIANILFTAIVATVVIAGVLGNAVSYGEQKFVCNSNTHPQ